ncbi:MAG: ribonuclease Z [Verrucomicrobiae bacterium]|nr:ribonuclease Z [Verrucomicrobiae bacterium]
MPTLKILGSASGVPTKKRFTTSFVAGMGEGYYLFDAGEACATHLVRSGIPHNRIKAVFISHMDPDHSGGIFMVVQLMELTGRTAPLKIFVPPEAVGAVRNYFRTVWLFPEVLRFKLEILPYCEGRPVYRDRNLSVRVWGNQHLKRRLQSRYPKLKLESYSFLVRGGGKTLVYSGDIARADELDPLLNGKTDLLVAELAHFKPEEIMAYLAGKKIRKIIFTHLHPDLDNQERRLEKMGDRLLGKSKLAVAHDGLSLGF